MGNFRQHITCSTITGVGVGAVAFHFGFSPPECLVAVGLCSVAGMLPDIDSNTSKSFRKCLYVVAGLGAILIVSRLWHLGFGTGLAISCGAFAFIGIRFGIGTFIKKYTVHRGMIHSVPVAVLCGQFLFFVVSGTIEERLIKSAALTVGFLSHLVLDEIYSIGSSKFINKKRSFGTALKWTNPKKKGLVTALYLVIFCLACAIVREYSCELALK